ncbi:hypothetical protein AAG906_017882 [Vitis piasezkii]
MSNPQQQWTPAQSNQGMLSSQQADQPQGFLEQVLFSLYNLNSRSSDGYGSRGRKRVMNVAQGAGETVMNVAQGTGQTVMSAAHGARDRQEIAWS